MKRVLIIPEDPTLDQHVLRPVVAQIFQDLGRRSRVEVLTDPHLFIIAVDRDCDQYHAEAKARQRVHEHPGKLLACLAKQEIEVWALALHRKELGKPWDDVRRECHPKEQFWDPFVRSKGWIGEVGAGRKRAMKELGRGWHGLMQVCPEIAALRREIEEWLGP